LAKRVFELAREIGVQSKDVLTKCRAEGLDLKNHMATLSAGLEATIREWFSEVGPADVSPHTAVETTEHVDLVVARKKAKKASRKRSKDAEIEADAPPAPVEGDQAEGDGAEAEQAPPEVPVEQPVAEVVPPAAPVVDAPAEQPLAEVAEVEAVEPAAGTIAQGPTVLPPPAAEEPASEAAPSAPEPEPAPALVAETPQEQPPAAAEVVAQVKEPEPEQPPAEEVEPPKPKVQAMGPQVVPKPATLKGPRVIRVERPDFVSIPPRRRPPAGGSRPPMRGGAQRGGDRGGAVAPAIGNAGAGERRTPVRGRVAATTAAKKPKKRSPRRRGGQVLDSGEKLKEWRNRDLMERSERLAAASGGLRRRRPSSGGKQYAGAGGERSGQIEIDEPISIKSFSAATGIRSALVIKRLMGQGILATINQTLTNEMAEEIALEHDVELAIRLAKTAEDMLIEQFEGRVAGALAPRAPVVTFLGHVDHGKTSLLDYIRKTKVASGEAGGITQHTGAYRFDDGDKHVVFLDTPGHEAFTEMRARGANMTDVVVLVVAADDGIMPQTVEAINHAKAANVPIVVALNKIDMPNANIQRALGQLAEHELHPRDWGGTTEVIHTSAITGEGMDTLVETLSLEAEILELKADPSAPASGYVIEAEMNPGLGVVARLLVRDGTLRVGDVLLAGGGYGRVRRMTDPMGNVVTESGPATPVEVSGLDTVPDAGDRFHVADNIEQARGIAEDRNQSARAEALSGSKQLTLENLFEQIEAGEAHELPIIIKGDVQGTVEALCASLNKLSTEEVRVQILHTGVGGISTGDVTLAEASNAIIIGFNVVADGKARQLAERSGVDIRTYRVIYEIIDDVRRALEEGLAPEIREEIVGHAEIRQTFKVSRVGTIAGCFVTDGVAVRNGEVRIVRNNVVVEGERKLDSLKRFKDDAREVKAGLECGLKVAGYDDLKEGDVLEFYKRVEVARTL